MEFDTFETKQANSAKYISKAGNPFLEEYEYKINEKGEKKLVKTDRKTNVHERIQADYDSTDINKLMLRFSLGDESAINVREGQYLDVTEMPTTLAEVFDRALQAEQLFVELPTDLKEMFNNSATEFFSSFGTKEFNDKINDYNDRFVDHDFEVEPIKNEPPKEFVEVER